MSLIGGTAAIYSSLLRHPSSTLTPLSLVFMMLLAIQYAIQPRLSKKLISPKVNKQSVALVEEVVKTTMAAVIFCHKPTPVIQRALQGAFYLLYIYIYTIAICCCVSWLSANVFCIAR